MTSHDSRHSETAFESVIEADLLASGYTTQSRDDFDALRGIFPNRVLEFIRGTQPKEWSKLEALHGDKTGDQVLADLCKWMDANGSLTTLRHGFKCYGRTLQVAFFKAAHELNPELEERYAANRLGLTRQLRFSPRSEKSLDVTISLNGIPVATLELKNPLTGQTVEHARRQYKFDRDPREVIFEFKRRTLVHFAVDTESVLMTTRLAAEATHFLPFNKGCDGGAGNPPDPQGRTYRTAYLWEEVLQRDSLLDLLARFIHLQVDEKRDDQGRKVKTESMIFPRYHQLRAVRMLVEAARSEGVGHNYLVEHSAGSGKSNTIGWLTHRLASLHDAKNERVFDSVIVVTDRIVLDQQLQDTIYQFEHKRGVVQKIDESSRQLAEALENAVPIIITTMQKFPFVSRQLLKMAEERGAAATGTLATRRCAVIIDEAHSSQGGETATDLKEVLAGDRLLEEAKERAAEEGLSDMDELYRSMAKRGRQANLSFFAFTATPKHKTLAVFGRNGVPTHRYTMRQAIEEGFILDVLKHYTSYATYFKLLKACADDPNVERKKAARALARFMRLHPHNIAQKTEVMVEHFQAVTRHKIGGRAKAMVLTGSRIEAVRYKQSFDRYIKEKGYAIRCLVAFSGTVQDDKLRGVNYTEVGMNQGISAKELPGKFASQEYQVLLVAEKYQTGFDQPLLHTMFVDKRLAGIQAVQTLSRLNRIHPFKEDTFVLDFVNDREEIREAFKTYYEGTEMGQEVDPARMYAIKGELDASGFYLNEEVQRFCSVYFKPKQRQSSMDHQAMNAALDPAVSRYIARQAESTDEAELWRGKVQALLNLYAFLSQVIPYQDSDLERLYVFLRHLSAKLPRRNGGQAYQFDDEVRLEYYRLQKTSEGSISLREGEGRRLDGPTEVGSGLNRVEPVPLSQLIDIVNERFGTDFNQADQLFFDQIVTAALGDNGLKQAAAVNPEDKFELVFKNLLDKLFVERMDQNEEIFVRFMNDLPFQRVVTAWMASEAYRRLRSDVTDEAKLLRQHSEADGAGPRFSIVRPLAEDRYATCVPLVTLKAAAGAFSSPQDAEEEFQTWVTVESKHRLRPGMFVAQVVGKSMEPRIPDGAWCLFVGPVEGSRQGRVLLVQHRDIRDPDTDARLTVKRYESEKVVDAEGSWLHSIIRLLPINPAYQPIVLKDIEEGEVSVVAELIEVLSSKRPSHQIEHTEQCENGDPPVY
jgi:type I restriction enzyme R subunit